MAGTEDAKKLCASFPNLRGLEPLPAGAWEEIQIPALSPKVRQGKLDNGLTYYILPNSEPQKRAEIHLVVGFGSLVEEEDQRGGAHIIEHLGFSATKHYENHDIVKLLESIGATFGACQNAYTSFDRTVYHLHVASDDWEILRKTLSVLREFAFWTRISDEDLARERHVVLDEWRQSKSAMGRLMESYAKAITKGSLYAERMPIGTEEVILHCPSARLREFYRKFYHPQQMALAVVGDFDVEQMTAAIKENFGMSIEELEREPTAPARLSPEVPLHTEPRFVLSEDPELAMSVVLVENVRPRRPTLRTVADFEQLIAEKLCMKALNNRLFKVVMRKDSVVYQASITPSAFCPSIEGIQVSVSPADGKILEAMHVVLDEVERVKRFGLHDSEVRRCKLSLLAEYEEAYIERNQTDSSSHASELVTVFMDGVPAPGIEYESRMMHAVLTEGKITTERVAAVASNFDPWGNTVYKVAAPRQGFFKRRASVQEADIQKLLERLRAGREALEPWPEDADDVETRLQRRFMGAVEKWGTQLPEDEEVEVREVYFGDAFGKSESSAVAPAPEEDGAASVSGLAEGQAIGEELRLSNGIRVFLRRNDILDDEVLMRGVSWGGLSEAMDTESLLCEAMNSIVVAGELDVYGLRPEELTECLEGMRVSPPALSLGVYRSQVTADCSPADLETMLLLLHLLFASPVEPKPEYLETLMQMLIEQRLAEDRSPQCIYGKRCDCINTLDHPFYKSPALERLKKLDFKTACDVFGAKLSVPSQWTFVLVGKLPETKEVVSLLQKYMGSIPERPPPPPDVTHPAVQALCKTHTAETVSPINVSFPSTSVPWEVVKVTMVDPQCRVLISSPLQLEGSDDDDPFKEVKQVLALTHLWPLVETKLNERLRFNLGKTYRVSIGDSFDVSPPHPSVPKRGTISISFGCDPADAKELADQVMAELGKLRAEGFSDEQVASVKEQERLSFEKALRSNGFWESTIVNLYFSRAFKANKCDIAEAVNNWRRNYDESLRSLSAASAAATLLKALPEDGVRTMIVMMPQAPRKMCTIL